MPTKTNHNSPLQVGGAAGALINVAKTVSPEILAKAAGPVAKKGLGALLGGAIKANPVGAVLTGLKGIAGGIGEVVSDRREALAAGEKYGFGEGLKDAATGFLKGATGIDLTDQDVYEQPEYTTNIDPMTGQEIPLTMTGKQKPFKGLMQMQGTTAHNMSAKQYNKALQMKEISGAATMPEKSDIKMADLSGDGITTFKDVLIGRGVIDKEGNKIK